MLEYTLEQKKKEEQQKDNRLIMKLNNKTRNDRYIILHSF